MAKDVLDEIPNLKTIDIPQKEEDVVSSIPDLNTIDTIPDLNKVEASSIADIPNLKTVGDKPEVKEGGAFVGEDIRLSELEDIASRNQVDVSLLKRLAPYYGASVEGQEGIAQTVGRGVGFASEALGGIPTFLAKKLSPEIGEKEERALDELNKLAQKKKSYLQAGTEMAAGLIVPGAAAVKGGKLAATAAAGIEGAAYGIGESEKGEELSSAAIGAGVGVAAGPVIGGVVKAGGKTIKAIKDVYKATKSTKEAAKDFVEEAAVKKANVTDEILEMETRNMEAGLEEGRRIYKAALKEEWAEVTKAQANLMVPGRTEKAWKKALTDKAYKLSEDDFALAYQRQKNLKDLEAYKGALKESSKVASDLRRASNTVIDGTSVVRDIDVRHNEDFLTTIHRMGQGINLSSYKFKNISDEYVEPLGRKLYELGKKKQSQLLDEIETSKTGPVSEEFKEVAESWRNTMTHIKELANEKGVPIKELSGEKGYVPRMPVSIAESVVRMENKVDEIGKSLRIDPLKISNEAFEKLTNRDVYKTDEVLRREAGIFRPLIKTVEYYTGKTPKNAEEFKSMFGELLIPGSDLRAKADNEIGALFQRSNALPEYLRERDMVKLVSNYAASVVKYAYMKDPMAELQYKINRLKVLTKKSVSGEASRDVAQLQRMLDGYKGDMVGLPKAAKNAEIAITSKMLRVAYKLPEESPGRAFMEVAAQVPEMIKGLHGNMYANFLQNPVTALNNITGAIFTYIPEMGNIYGNTLVIPAMLRATAKLSQPKYWKKLYEKGILQVEPGRWFVEAARGGRPQGLIGRGLKLSSDALMLPFSVGEAFVRSMVYETSEMVLASLKKSNFGIDSKELIGKAVLEKSAISTPWQKMANMYVDKMPPRLAKNMRQLHLKVLEAKKAGNKELAAKLEEQLDADFNLYVVDRIAFSYNKITRSEASTYAGSWLSAFTKYPSVIGGRAMESLREPPSLAGKGARVASYFVIPYISASILNHLIFSENEEIEEILLGKQRGDDFFGRGIAGLTPMGTVSALTTEGLRAPLPAQMVGKVAQAVGKLAEGDPEGLQKLGKVVIETYTPGGLGGFSRTLETVTDVDIPFLGKEK